MYMNVFGTSIQNMELMKKIKYITCIGSSFTAGGGFEFDSEYRKIANKKRYQLYSGLGEKMLPYNFSWPGQLQKLIGDDVIVYNIAKQGYGNQRTYRILYDIINDEKKVFKKDENLFLIELTALGRDEYFFNNLNDYIVSNYNLSEDGNSFIYSASARDYFYQTKDEELLLEKYNEFFSKFVSEFKNVREESEKLQREMDLFISYLNYKNINFLFVSPPSEFFISYDSSKSIKFGDDKYFKSSNSFVEFFYDNKLTITDETHGTELDGHAGLKANKIGAHCIYNSLVDNGFIDKPKKEIDWKYFSELEVIKKDKILL